MTDAVRSACAVSLILACASAQDIYDIDKIRTIEVTAPTNWRSVMASNYATKTYIKADVKIDNVVYKDCGVRHRGFSTYRFLPRGKEDKRPWKIALDEFVPGQRVQGYRTLNINNNVWDPSFIREVAGYEFMRRFLPAPKCCYVKLEVNGESLGLFVNTQQINKDFLQEWFRDDEGNRYRGERSDRTAPWSNSALTWLGPNQPTYARSYELKTESSPHFPWTELIRACNVLNNTALSQLKTDVPKAIDVDGGLRFMAAANITAWLDSYLGRVCHNFYLYEDVHHGRLTIQPWDLNNGFGGLTDGLGINGVARMDPFYRENDAQNPRPLLSKTVQLPEWRARYLAHYRDMLEEFSWSKMGPRINALRTMIRPALVADTKRIYTVQQFDANMTQNVWVGFVTANAIQPFFQNREAFLKAHSAINRNAPALANLSHLPLSPDARQSVTVNVTVSGATPKNVTLYYRTKGPFLETPMFDDGMHGDGAANDGVWGAAIPPHGALQPVDYYASANTDLVTGAMAFLPEGAEFRPNGYRVRGEPPKGPILISEFVAKNDTGMRDEFGETDDWLELANAGTQAVTISGMYLTDSVANPTKWQIPANQTLQPGQTVIVWCDDEGTQGPMHASFKIAAGGEELALYDKDGKTNLDWIEFGVQQPDVSAGRLPGFLTVDVTFSVPTPNQINQATPCGHLSYGPPDATAAGFGLTGGGKPAIGQSVTYVANNAAPSSPGIAFLGFGPLALELPGMNPLLVNPLALFLLAPFQTDATGAGSTPFLIPNLAGLKGQTLYLQAFVLQGGNGTLSNAVATRICQGV